MHPFTDIDDCQPNNGGCAQICTDLVNDVECSCDPGFILAADEMNCDSKYGDSYYAQHLYSTMIWNGVN